MFQLSFVVKKTDGKIAAAYLGEDAGAAEAAFEAARGDVKNEDVALYQTPTPRLTACPASDALAAKAALKEREERAAKELEASRDRIVADVKDAEAKLKAAKAVAATLPKAESVKP